MVRTKLSFWYDLRQASTHGRHIQNQCTRKCTKKRTHLASEAAFSTAASSAASFVAAAASSGLQR